MKFKWLGSLVGGLLGGPLGALVGFAYGAYIDHSQTASTVSTDNLSHQQRHDTFLLMLLAQMAYVIRADKKIMHSEMELARQFLRTNFGEAAMQEGEAILLRFFQQQKEDEYYGRNTFQRMVIEAGAQLCSIYSYEQRLQLLSFLAQIAKADGELHPLEVNALREIAQSMDIPLNELEALLHLEDRTLEGAYRLLQISPSATDAEVKAAFRKLALQYHPDRVAALGEDVRLAAEKKFQAINEAKDLVYKSRGL